MLSAFVAFLGLATSGGLQAPAREFRLVPQTSAVRLYFMEVSPDGSRLLTQEAQGYSPRLWDARNLRLLRVLDGHDDPVVGMAFAPDGQKLATISENRVLVWDAVRAQVLRRFERQKAAFSKAAFAGPDRLAVGTDLGFLEIFDLTSGGRNTLQPHSKCILWVDASKDGKRVLTVSEDGNGATLDPARPTRITELLGHTAPVPWGYLSQDGSMALTTGRDGSARVFDALTGKPIQRFDHSIGFRNPPPERVGALWVGKSGTEVLVAGKDGTLTLHDPRTGAIKRSLPGQGDPLREIRLSPDRTKVGTYDDISVFAPEEKLANALRLWDVVEGKRLPFRVVDDRPMAATFGHDSTAFLVGYEDGSIRSHRLADGEVTGEQLGAALTLEEVAFFGQEGGVWASPGSPGGFVLAPGSLRVTPQLLRHRGNRRPVFSPDGRWVFHMDLVDGQKLGWLSGTSDMKTLIGLRNVRGAAFSGDGTRLAVWFTDGDVLLYETRAGKQLFGWTWSGTQGGLDCLALNSDGTEAFSIGHANGSLLHWNLETGKILREIGTTDATNTSLAFSPDGKRVAAADIDGVSIITLSDGTFVTQRYALGPQPRILWSADGTRLAAHEAGRAVLVDTSNAKQLSAFTPDENAAFGAAVFSPDLRYVAISNGRRATVKDAVTGRAVSEVEAKDQISQVGFTPKSDRLYLVDGTDGVSLHDPASGRRLASLLSLKTGHWLALDEEGRYDASDPSNVEGAFYVKNWEGGLETIAVHQLKSVFYEPGLFAKVLGVEKEPMRPVPSLSGLRLFPSLTLQNRPNDPLKVQIGATERDGGGIGKVEVYLNGKLVETKAGTGFFTFDANRFRQFLLPESQLPKGRGNLIQVTASNREGTLTSPAVTLDLGIPEGLKTPEVRLFALCVGVGDYAGAKADLVAPPNDAKTLAKALRTSAERLLPGRVQVQTLTTDDEAKPTRPAIRAWFEGVAKQATSADIVLVFFAGHGLSKLGDRRDYFFLTAEADPTDMTGPAAAAGTLSGDELRTLLTAIPAGKQIVILDTCHSGAAGESLVGADRGVGSDYQRAFESIKDATGTWLLAGSAADQLSYESPNVEHGMLTYALLEAIDRASPEGLRATTSGELFIDVERWLTYAANRVESLKNEVGLKGIQRPEFKRSKASLPFDVGVLREDHRGKIGLRPPRPIVILGEIEQDKEDPLGLEEPIQRVLRESEVFKAWTDVSRHPNVYRVAASYETVDGTLKLTVFLQRFDERMARRTVERFELTQPMSGGQVNVPALAGQVRAEVERRIVAAESAQKGGT